MILYLAWFLELRSRPRSFGVNDVCTRSLPALGLVLLLVGLVCSSPTWAPRSKSSSSRWPCSLWPGFPENTFFARARRRCRRSIWPIVHVSYRYVRVMAFLHPDADPLGHGFQLMQSLIAVGSGGFTGVGLMESKQKLFYLPEAHTDFIFAVLCEELGFIGGAIVLALFAVYAWRGLRAGVRAPDDFGRFLALGITVMVAEPGADQSGRRAGHDAHQGYSAAVHQLWRIEPFCHAFGHGRAPEYQPAGELSAWIHQETSALKFAQPEPEKRAELKLLIAGGGTGGHVFPAIAVAREWLGAMHAKGSGFRGHAARHGIAPGAASRASRSRRFARLD